jgi:hypothetical protein
MFSVFTDPHISKEESVPITHQKCYAASSKAGNAKMGHDKYTVTGQPYSKRTPHPLSRVTVQGSQTKFSIKDNIFLTDEE